MCPGYGGVCASTRCSGEPPCRPDEKIGVSCRRPRRPSRVVRVVSVLFLWCPSLLAAPSSGPKEKSSMSPSEHRVVQIDSIGPSLLHSDRLPPRDASSSNSNSRRFRKARPRSCNNRSVYSSNRWGRNVRTVAAIVPELDPKTDRIGNWSSADWRASYPEATLAVLSGGPLVESDVLATPKW